MILERETFKKFGYYPNQLLKESHKLVVWQCEDCKIIKIWEKRQNYKFCKKCSVKGFRNPNFGNGSKISGINNYWYGKKGREIPNYIDGRTNKKYFCKDCGCKISSTGGIYKGGRCKSCSKVGNKLSKKIRQKISFVRKENWKNKNYRNMMARSIIKGLQLKPNKPEKALNNLLKLLFKNEYRYVGDGKIILDGFNPDFININGQKKIIELYGDYWHNLSDYKKRDRRRLKSYTRLGYRTLIIWEHELKDLNLVAGKLIAFHEASK